MKGRRVGIATVALLSLVAVLVYEYRRRPVYTATVMITSVGDCDFVRTRIGEQETVTASGDLVRHAWMLFGCAGGLDRLNEKQLTDVRSALATFVSATTWEELQIMSDSACRDATDRVNRSTGAATARTVMPAHLELRRARLQDDGTAGAEEGGKAGSQARRK
jgi:hypothetical protein